MASLSRRAAGLVAYSYDDFPVDAGDLDLRADTSPPLPTVDSILRRHLSVTADDLASYGPVEGEPALRQALADIFAATAEQVIVTAGGSEALFLALTCLAEPGDAVLLPRPAFPGYDQLAHLIGLHPVHYPVPGPAPATGHGAAVRVVCTPHNPTGVVTPRAVSGRRDDATWTVWDLCHMPLTGAEVDDFRTGLDPREVLLFSLSKLLRLPGTRVGCLVAGSPDLVAAATAVKTHLSMSTSRLSQRLAAQVLASAVARRQIATRHTSLAQLREQLHAAVQESSRLTAVPARGGTHLLVHAKGDGDPWQILKDAGVVGLPGVVFNSPVPAVRLCTAQPVDVIDAAAKVVRGL
jgi:aspartate/methionine/tyrosine aminotransferase